MFTTIWNHLVGREQSSSAVSDPWIDLIQSSWSDNPSDAKPTNLTKQSSEPTNRDISIGHAMAINEIIATSREATREAMREAATQLE